MAQIYDYGQRIVIIEVNGGVAECTSQPNDVQVHIVDWDTIRHEGGITCPACKSDVIRPDPASLDRFTCNDCSASFPWPPDSTVDEDESVPDDLSLDDVISDHMAYCAAKINNEGPKTQRAYLKELGDPGILPDHHLDQMIHDALSAQAAEVNNRGHAGQVAYLKEQGWTIAEIREVAETYRDIEA